jgi:hypothetical protein
VEDSSSIPAEVIAPAIVLQTLHGLSDAEAVEAATFNLRRKTACGLAGRDGVHPITLTVWRGSPPAAEELTVRVEPVALDSVVAPMCPSGPVAVRWGASRRR